MKTKVAFTLLLSFLLIPVYAYAQFGPAILDGVLRGFSSSRSPSSDDKQYAKTVFDINEFYPEVSRIELRAMQTRKFKKTPNEVLSAIKSLCADANGQFSGTLPVYKGVGKIIGEIKTPIGPNAYSSEFKYESYEKDERFNRLPIICSRPTGLGGGEFSLNDKPGIYKFANITYELDWNPNNNSETYVRLRITWSEDARRGVSIGSTTKQTTNPIFYQSNFKELADGLFIDAIQLTPAEMQ